MVRISLANLLQLVYFFKKRRIIRRFDNHFFARDVAFRAQAQQTFEESCIDIRIEHNGIIVSLIRQEATQGSEHHSRNPHTENHIPRAVARHLHARSVDDVIENEENHGDDGRHTQSSLANNSPQGCTNEEEKYAGDRHRKLLMPLDAVCAHALIAFFRSQAFPL